MVLSNLKLPFSKDISSPTDILNYSNTNCVFFRHLLVMNFSDMLSPAISFEFLCSLSAPFPGRVSVFISPHAAQIELHCHDQNHAEGTILNNLNKQTKPPSKKTKNLKGILVLNMYLILLLLYSLAQISNFYGITFPISIVSCTEMLFGGLF